MHISFQVIFCNLFRVIHTVAHLSGIHLCLKLIGKRNFVCHINEPFCIIRLLVLSKKCRSHAHNQFTKRTTLFCTVPYGFKPIDGVAIFHLQSTIDDITFRLTICHKYRRNILHFVAIHTANFIHRLKHHSITIILRQCFEVILQFKVAIILLCHYKHGCHTNEVSLYRLSLAIEICQFHVCTSITPTGLLQIVAVFAIYLIHWLDGFSQFALSQLV